MLWPVVDLAQQIEAQRGDLRATAHGIAEEQTDIVGADRFFRDPSLQPKEQVFGVAFQDDLNAPVRGGVNDHVRQTSLCEWVQMDLRLKDAKFPQHFLVNEWTEVVDAQQLSSWEAYRDAARLGRKTRLGEKQRQVLWSIFEAVAAGLRDRKLVTWAHIFGRLAEQASAGKSLGYDFVVVDEAQDLSMPEARFLAAMAGNKADGLFFAGDLGQRIFQQPFSWKSLGIDVRGRSNSLRINYRTSHQIRTQADRLLPGVVSDVDGTQENRRGTVSLFDGPAPVIRLFNDEAAEGAAVGAWIAERLREGCAPPEIGILVRSAAQVGRARAAVKAAGAKAVEFDEKVEGAAGAVSISQMHLAKGLEFRAVAVMACDDEVLPLQERVETVTDEADLVEVYETERHLLYVACTRARDSLWISGVTPGSEFLKDVLQ